MSIQKKVVEACGCPRKEADNVLNFLNDMGHRPSEIRPDQFDGLMREAWIALQETRTSDEA